MVKIAAFLVTFALKYAKKCVKIIVAKNERNSHGGENNEQKY